MIEPGRSGHRNRAVARDAARQVSTTKNGFRLTWILSLSNAAQPLRSDDRETPPCVSRDHGAAALKRLIGNHFKADDAKVSTGA